MLLLDPESRVTASEGLALPYFSEFREPEEETEALPYDHTLDNAEQTLEQWKRKERVAVTFKGTVWWKSYLCNFPLTSNGKM